VRIHAIEVYERGPYICGFEVYYVVDGEVTKYTMHYKTKKEKSKLSKVLSHKKVGLNVDDL
jgi:hypothetical protein